MLWSQIEQDDHQGQDWLCILARKRRALGDRHRQLGTLQRTRLAEVASDRGFKVSALLRR